MRWKWSCALIWVFVSLAGCREQRDSSIKRQAVKVIYLLHTYLPQSTLLPLALT